MQGTELREILTAIREVEASLDRRASRVGGALMIMWGAIVALISGFYQLVAWNGAAYHAALGPFLHWVWLAPVAAGYAAGALVNVRMSGRLGEADRRQVLLDLGPAILSTLIAVALVVLERNVLIPGALLVGFSVSCLLRVRAGRPTPRFLRAAGATSTLCAVAGVALLVWPVAWAWTALGVLFGGSLLLLGRLRMSL